MCTFSGGSVPVFDEVIISTSLMNEVINLDETAGDSKFLHTNYIFIRVASPKEIALFQLPQFCL